MTSTVVTEEKTEAISNPKKIGLVFLFFVLLGFFILVKLPQNKITALIQGYAQKSLDPFGIYISDQGRELSIWKGFRYRLVQPTLELPDQSRVELDEIVITPTLLSLFTGKAGVQVDVSQILNKSATKTDYSHIQINGTTSGDFVDATISIQDLDIGKFGLLAFAGGIKGSGQIAGDIHIDGKLSDLPSLAGRINLKLKKVHLDEQNLFGFQLPPMEINDGVIDAVIERGKVVMKQVQIGKNTDDIQVGLTGDIGINKNLNSSILNLRTTLGFSDKVKQSLALLDSILGVAKQPDGKYVYKLTGTLSAPFPIPEQK